MKLTRLFRETEFGFAVKNLRAQPLRHQIAVCLLLTVLVEGCGGSTLLKSFRAALASSSPLVNSLATSGLIPKERAQVIITDFNDGAQCGLVLQEMFSAIPKDLPADEIKTRKFQAASNALTCFRTIINRQNFAANKRVQDIANIAEGVLASLVIFYAPPGRGAGRPPAHAVTAGSEKELEEKLKAKVDEIERLMKPTN